MKINGIVLDTLQFGDNFKLVDVHAANVYENGNRTDRISGYRYTVVMVDYGFERIDVTIDGTKQMEKPDKPCDVVINGFTPVIAWRGGDYTVTARAIGISPIGTKPTKS